MRLFALLGVVVAVVIISHILASDSDDIKFYIFWGFLAVCLASFITGFITFFLRKKELGLWLILTPCIVATAALWAIAE
jgi:hypothetical protein